MLKFHKKNTQNAQGMVEFALVLPILLLLIFGVIAFGHLFFVYSFTVAASREAARWGSAVGTTASGLPRFRDCDEILETAVRVGGIAGVRPENIVIEYDHGPDSVAPYATCPAGGEGPDVALSDRIIVTTVVNYEPIVPLIDIPDFPMEAVTARTIIRGLPVGEAPPIPPSCISTYFEFMVMTGELDVLTTESIDWSLKAVGSQQPAVGSGLVNIWIGGNQEVTNSNQLSGSITFKPNASGDFEVRGIYKSNDPKFCSVDPAAIFPIKVRKVPELVFIQDQPDPSKYDEGVVIKVQVTSKIGTTVPIPTGIVNVSDKLDGGIGCQIVLEADGTGTCLLAGYPASGARTLQAIYYGDDDYGVTNPPVYEAHTVVGEVPPTLIPTPTIAASPTPKPLCPVLVSSFNFTEQKDGFWVSINNPDATQAKLYNLTVTWPSVASGDALLKEVRYDTTTTAVCNPASPTPACIWVPSGLPLEPTSRTIGMEGEVSWSGPAKLDLQPGQTKQLRFVYTSALPNTSKKNPVKYSLTIQFDKMVNNQRCKIVIPATERNVK